MRLIRKTVTFARVFSVVFFVLHTADSTGMIIGADLDDLGGMHWLYSAVCLIFSILAGFVIQHEWDQWNALTEAMNEEVSALQYLWLWSQHMPDLRMSLHEALRQYLTVTIQDEWRPDAQSESEAAQKSLAMIWEAVAAVPPSPNLVMPATMIVGDLLRHREHRLHSGQRRMPSILKVTVGFADGWIGDRPVVVRRRETFVARLPLYSQHCTAGVCRLSGDRRFSIPSGQGSGM